MGKFGNVFPYEVYVEGVLKKHFQTLGYTVDKGNPYRAEADLICIDPLTNETWMIQVKGKTKAIGVDFNTCLGQIIKNMTNPDHKHAIAFPDINEYWEQVRKIPFWVRKKLNLYVIFVNEFEDVRLIHPNEEV
jgi:hypothetical protein